MTLVRLIAGLVLSAGALVLRHDAGQVPGAAAHGCEWNQPRGDSGGTADSCAEPMLSEPVEEWRHDFDGVLCQPVAWGGVVYAVVRDGRSTKLVAFRIQGGEPLGETQLRVTGSVALAVWQGSVAVVDAAAIRLYTHREGRFQRGSSLDAAKAWVAAPVVHEGLLLALDGADLKLVDLQHLKCLGSVPAGAGRPAVAPTGGDGEARVATLGFGLGPDGRGFFLKLHLSLLQGLGTEKPTLRPEQVLILGNAGEPAGDEEGYAVHLSSAPGSRGQWFLRSPRGIEAVNGSHYQGILTDDLEGFGNHLAPLVSDVAVHAGGIFGFTGEGSLVRMDATGGFGEVVARDKLPAGARPGGAAVAGGVLYLGNWAVEVESRRVLWCLKGIEPASALLPLADRRAVYTTATSIVCLADPVLAAGAGAGVGGSLAARGVRIPRPAAGDGVILADGTLVPGSASVDAGGRVTIAGNAGADLGQGDVALLITGEKVVRLGPEYPVLLAWDRALHAEMVEHLESLFASYLLSRHVADCQRLLAEAEVYGLDPARAQQLGEQLVGKAENRSDNAEAQRTRKGKDEADERADMERAFLEGAAWCGARGLGGAATVLASEALRIRPAADHAEIAASVGPWIPPEFPWLDAADAAQRWMAWAPELLPAGATFCRRDDPAWKRATSGPWQAGAVALRTEHLQLLTLEHEPEIVGACLRRGEGTLLALEELLGPPEPPAPPGSARLEVRLHADRASYLSEHLPSGDHALAWSAGHYSRAERVSRFYVPRGEDQQLLGRSLAQVVAHELTHHYIDQVWLGKASQEIDPSRPGYWIVEGIARYVEDQVLELGRATRRFDDPTVRSLDIASQVDAGRRLLPLEKLVDGSLLDFDRLSDTADIPIQLRFTLRRAQLSERVVFYEQAGSLVFFLMNRRGDQGRAALVAYLRDFYGRRSAGEGWVRLGWPSAEALERDLRAFLEGVREG